MNTRLRPLLGTFVEVHVRGLEERRAQAAIEEAFACIRTVDERMSAHEPQSDLGRLYERGAFEAIEVHPWTFRVIRASLFLQWLSDGIFDISVGQVLAQNRFLPVWHPRVIVNPCAVLFDIELLDDFRIRFRRPLRIDLGGIAKGFVVDRAVEALLAAGAESGCVNAGGDFRIFGPRAEPLVLRNPGNPRQLVRVGEIQVGAVATSATYFSRRKRDNRMASPLIDGRTRMSLDFPESITVIASSCMWADALTKTMAADPQRGASLLKHFDAHAFSLSSNKSGSRLRVLRIPAEIDAAIKPKRKNGPAHDQNL